MKKRLFLAALAGLALAGCVKNEVADSVKESKPVAFESPVLYSNVNTGTKAEYKGEIGSFTYGGSTGTYLYPREEHFRIFAVQHEGNFNTWAEATACAFNGQAIAYDGSLDAWAPKKQADKSYYYWPDGKMLSFAAFSPADLQQTNKDAAPTYSGTGFVLENFVVADNPADQFDMLFSERIVDQTSSNMVNNPTYYSGIPIVFKHALTSIHFSLVKEQSVTEEVYLTGITLKNVINKGTFVENITNEKAYASAPYWTESTAAQDVKDYVSFTGSVEFPLSVQYVSSLAEKDTDAEGENEISHPLLLLPQALSNNVQLVINYKVGDEAKTKTVQLNQYPKGSNKTPITEWAIGTRYTYRITYGKSSEMQDIIYFSPSTEGWKDVLGIEIVL